MSFTRFYNKKATFQAIKTRSSESRKIDIYPKGLTHGFGPKMAIFPTFFFNAILARKLSFTKFYNVKSTFQAIKTRSLKNRKIIIFPKGLTHGFGPKKAIFSRFFFWAIQARKMSFTIFQNEETSFQAIKTRSLKRRKIDIFSKGLTHGFWSKKWPSFQFVFFMQYRQGKCVLRYSRTKKHLSRVEKQKVRKVEKLTYFQIG